MDKPYLLTYNSLIQMSGFSWFDTEEEMDEFIEENKKFDIEVIDAVYIISAENLDK